MLNKSHEDFPDRFSESWTIVAKLLREVFVSKSFPNTQPTVFMSYAWVDKKDSLPKNFGNSVNGIPIEDCDIQQQLVQIKLLLESIGFFVHLDIQNNDHAGPELAVQLKTKITSYDFRICALTPMFKAKVEKLNSNSKPYVLREEYDLINGLSSEHKTFRFIFVGDRTNAVPENWIRYLATEQSLKSNMQRLEFIVRKLCVSPTLRADDGVNLFNAIWAQQLEKQPKSSYAAIAKSLPKDDHDNNDPSPVGNVAKDIEGDEVNLVATGGSNSTGDIKATGNVNLISTGRGESDNDAAIRILEQLGKFSKK